MIAAMIAAIIAPKALPRAWEIGRSTGAVADAILKKTDGEMAEWLKAHAWKACLP
jgi:hypothetical protein